MGKHTIFFCFIFYYATSNAYQVIEIEMETIDIPGTVREAKEAPESSYGFRDKDKASSDKGSKGSITTTENEAYIKDDLSDELDYYLTYKNLPNYIVEQIGSVTKIESLEVLSIWDEPVTFPPNRISFPQYFDPYDAKSEFAEDIHHLVKNSNSKRHTTLKQKAANYNNYQNNKEFRRQYLEHQNYLPHVNPSPFKEKIFNLQRKGKYVFDRERHKFNMGNRRFGAIESIDAMELLFYTNTTLSQKMINPYSPSYYYVENKAIGNSPYEIAEMLYDTAEEILQFVEGTITGVEYQIKDFYHDFLYVDSFISYAIDNPKEAVNIALEQIYSFNFMAILDAYFTDMGEILTALDRGDSYKAGELFGRFGVNAVLFNMSSRPTAYTNFHTVNLREQGSIIFNQIKPILNNEIGGIRLTKSKAFKALPRLARKDIDGFSFPDEKKVQTKLQDHGDVFNIPESKRNEKTENMEYFKNMIINHMKDKNTVPVMGTYQDIKPKFVTNYYNPKTKINVIVTPQNEFWSVWKLDPKQQRQLIFKGHVGNKKTNE